MAQEEALEDEDRDFVLDPYGYVRIGFDYVLKDDNYDFIGRNPGFVAANARFGLDGHHDPSGFGFRASLEGAVDTNSELNSTQAELSFRLRDAYVRWRFHDVLEVRLGQMRPPHSGEEDRSTASLRFIDRAIGEHGVEVGQGFELAGLDPDRQLGLFIGSPDLIALGDAVELGYGVMIANGNGENELLNDNRQFAYYGRLELAFVERVRIGVGAYYNARTEGTQPDLYDEEDLGMTADLLVQIEGFEFYGQFMMLKTSYPTVSGPERTQLAAHGQVAYDFQIDHLRIGPGYRFGILMPYMKGGGDSLEDYQVQEHTIGVRALYDVDFGSFGAFLEFTLALEDDAREVDNHRLQALVQLEY